MKKQKKNKYGPLFAFCLKAVKIFGKKSKVVGQVPAQPCIFLCRHLDSGGVVQSLTSIPAVVRPWCLDCFTDRKSATKQLRDYTYSKRLKKGKLFCKIVPPIVATGYVALVKSAKCIPVYRGENSGKSVQTVIQSVRALENGENILIYNDIDYASTQNATDGDIYTGFTLVDKMYFRRNAKHIPVVPVFMDGKTTVIHPPVYCNEPNAVEKVKHGMYNRE